MSAEIDFCLYVVEFLQSLLGEEDYDSVDLHKFTNVIHHGVNVGCYLVRMVHTDEISPPLPCTLFMTFNSLSRQLRCWETNQVVQLD